MFMNDASKKDIIRNVAVQDLRKLGIKCRPKKQKQNVQETRVGRRLFKTTLHLLPMQTVTLASGQQLVVPKLVHELCSFILSKVETEGLFRKGGSKSRQNEIKLSLDAGCSLGDCHHEIDVANILKTFFRELPEPLFPYAYHDSFLHCTILQENKIEAILLTCLLLPSEHLNTLAYFMQFLNHVSEYSNINKMDAYNLAIIIGPTIFPTEEKLGVNTTHRLTKIYELFQILIENSSNIGVIPEQIIDKIIPLASSSANSICDDDGLLGKGKKKRRSGSLTRMFSGLRKIVGGKSSDDLVEVTPDILATPNLNKSARKRKIESAGFSTKKKRELVKNLPDGALLNTPVSVFTSKDKKQNNKRQKQNKQGENTTSVSSLASTKSIFVRRWSAVSQAAGFKRNKSRNSCDGLLTQTNPIVLTMEEKIEENEVINDGKSEMEPDYVKISRAEYEQIKNRVSAIENRLSLEFDNLQNCKEDVNANNENLNLIVKVQNAYEETLVMAEPLSPTTDQLARRLSKELKIRHSSEHKVIRSPSARKIGSLRRRSKERVMKVQRNKSWHVERCNIKRNSHSNTNTKSPQNLPCTTTEVIPNIQAVNPLTSPINKTNRASSFHGNNSPFVRGCRRNPSLFCNNSMNASNDLSKKWTSAEGFFSNMKNPNSFEELVNCRSSLARLRSQNAGMVLAKARLFDGMNDSSNSNVTQSPLCTKTNVRKIGQSRNLNRATNRNKNIKTNDKCGISNRKKIKTKKYSESTLSLQDYEKENEFRVNNLNNFSDDKKSYSLFKDYNSVDIHGMQKCMESQTSTFVPIIKKSLIVKSPKRLCRTPLTDENKKTPLRVLSSKYIY